VWFARRTSDDGKVSRSRGCRGLRRLRAEAASKCGCWRRVEVRVGGRTAESAVAARRVQGHGSFERDLLDADKATSGVSRLGGDGAACQAAFYSRDNVLRAGVERADPARTRAQTIRIMDIRTSTNGSRKTLKNTIPDRSMRAGVASGAVFKAEAAPVFLGSGHHLRPDFAAFRPGRGAAPIRIRVAAQAMRAARRHALPV